MHITLSDYSDMTLKYFMLLYTDTSFVKAGPPLSVPALSAAPNKYTQVSLRLQLPVKVLIS